MTASSFPELSPRELHIRWQTIIEARFSQVELCDCLASLHRELPAGSFWRELGRVMMLEKANPGHWPCPISLEAITNWQTTTRIDGILPLEIPLASDIALMAGWLLRQMGILDYDLPEPNLREQVEADIGLCLLGWLHRRSLKSTYGMMIELNTQCPRSATGAKEELCVMGELPNGGRTMVFYSSLKGRECLTIPDASVEYYDALDALRSENGTLFLHGRDLVSDEST